MDDYGMYVSDMDTRSWLGAKDDGEWLFLDGFVIRPVVLAARAFAFADLE